MDLDDVGMAQFCNNTRLPLEAYERIGIVIAQVAEDLDSYLVFEGSMRANLILSYPPTRHHRLNSDLSQPFPDPVSHDQIILKAPKPIQS